MLRYEKRRGRGILKTKTIQAARYRAKLYPSATSSNNSVPLFHFVSGAQLTHQRLAATITLNDVLGAKHLFAVFDHLLYGQKQRDGEDEQETQLEEELAGDGVEHIVVDRVNEVGVERDVQLRVPVCGRHVRMRQRGVWVG